eukprot:10120666-Lingulodinium_polyedra.AAC.1
MEVVERPKLHGQSAARVPSLVRIGFSLHLFPEQGLRSSHGSFSSDNSIGRLAANLACRENLR